MTWGAGPSGLLLAATLRQLFVRLDPDNERRTAAANFYHDEALQNFPNDEAAIRFIDYAIEWFETGDMRLAKWKANSAAVVEHLQPHSIELAEACFTEGAILKILSIGRVRSMC